MNTSKNKKKNRQNKPDNSNPQENVESEIKCEQKLENVSVVETTESVTKIEKRVPEILSDVVSLLSDKNDEPDTQGPKKPKRNRGKKKQSDSEEIVDESKTLCDETSITSKDKKTEKQEEIVKVEPIARKKKGKNKIKEDTKDETSTLQTTDTKAENIKTEAQEICEGPSEVIDEEIKTVKKKNKKSKKTRNDSDKCEKIEELLCTAAFQKILLPRNDDDVKIKENISTNDMKTAITSDSSVSEPTVKTVEKCTKHETEEEIDNSNLNKTGKKNKKEKKQKSKDDDLEKKIENKALDTEVIKKQEEVIIEAKETSSESLKPQIIAEPNERKLTKEKPTERVEEVLKPKAIIAKPVEKKVKGKISVPDIKPDIESTDTSKAQVIILENAEKDKDAIDVFSKTSDHIKPIEVNKDENKILIESATLMDRDQSDMDTKCSKVDDFKMTTDISLLGSKKMENLTESSNISILGAETLKVTKTEGVIEIDETTDLVKQVKPRQKKNKGKAHADEQFKLIEVFAKAASGKMEAANPVPVNIDVAVETLQDVTGTVAAEEKPETLKIGENVSYDESTTRDKTSEDTEVFEMVKHRQKKGKGKHSAHQVESSKIDLTDTDTAIKEEDSKKYIEILPSSIIAQVDHNIQQNISMKILGGEDTPIVTDKNQSKSPEINIDTVQKTNIINLPEEKKQKKSPKPSKKLEKLPPLEETKIDEDEKISKRDENTDEKIETPVLKQSTSDDKTPLTQSFSSDITPDIIESPRSTSADIIDNNNNTTIQELHSTESELSVPIVIPDTPFIQGSGETPMTSPIVIATCVKIDEIKQKDIQKEPLKKTDLKSQVMEVNKDMEELRLSIERSLAEFTALEKEEKEIGLVPKEIKINIELPNKEIKSDKEQHHGKQETLTEKPMDIIVDASAALSKIKEGYLKEEIAMEPISTSPEPPVCPSRKDNKGKNKSKKKGKQGNATATVTTTETSLSTKGIEDKDSTNQQSKSDETSKQKEDSKSSDSQEKEKKQAIFSDDGHTSQNIQDYSQAEETEGLQDFGPIEKFEDALTSSADDVNKTFEIIADEAMHANNTEQISKVVENPEIKVTESDECTDKTKEEEKQRRENPLVSQPKNLLGHPVIPARSNKTDYKKEKNKTPNTKLARVKIKDVADIDQSIKQSKESQTENKPKFIKNSNESVTCVTSENDEYVYKYSFRKVFLSSNCHVCKKDLRSFRVPCNFCFLTFYCSKEHKDFDYPQHQSLCFAVSTIVHLKGTKYIYADCQGVTGHNYRLLRMQAIVSCEKVLKRKLLPWEQEALLYPRMCADAGCREWRQGQLKDCEACGQISYCSDNQDHLPKSHARWCKSYSLYQQLVVYQLTQGRLDPRLPARLLNNSRICDNINRLLADMYDEKIDMNEMQYAALTQLSTAPLTAAYSYQLYSDKMKYITNGLSKNSFTVHVVGAELQFEADSLHKWETFLLHLRPGVELLRVVLVGPELNPSNLPLDLLGKIKLCATCRVEKRRLNFIFRDKQLYHEYWSSGDFITPDIVCAFNPSINRTAGYDDNWSSTINCIFRLKVPLLMTSYTMNELQRDLTAISKFAIVEYNTVSEAKFNPFASVRPDRNFITDDEMPLLFKNYVYTVLIGAF